MLALILWFGVVVRSVEAGAYNIVNLPSSILSISCSNKDSCTYSGTVVFQNVTGKDLYNTTLWTNAPYNGLEYIGFDGSWTYGQSSTDRIIKPGERILVQFKVKFPKEYPDNTYFAYLYIDGKTCKLDTTPPDCYFYGGTGLTVKLEVVSPTPTPILTPTPIPTSIPTPTPSPKLTPTPTFTPTPSFVSNSGMSRKMTQELTPTPSFAKKDTSNNVYLDGNKPLRVAYGVNRTEVAKSSNASKRAVSEKSTDSQVDRRSDSNVEGREKEVSQGSKRNPNKNFVNRREKSGYDSKSTVLKDKKDKEKTVLRKDIQVKESSKTEQNKLVNSSFSIVSKMRIAILSFFEKLRIVLRNFLT